MIVAADIECFKVFFSIPKHFQMTHLEGKAVLLGHPLYKFHYYLLLSIFILNTLTKKVLVLKHIVPTSFFLLKTLSHKYRFGDCKT
jgi:hypothetical protein